MRQWLLPGSVTTPDGLELQEVDVPRPGPGQVLVGVDAISWNARDQMILRGQMGRDGSDIVPLSDVAATIEELGSGVTGWAVGDRVMTAHVPAWRSGPAVPFGPGAGSAGDPGVAAEHLVLDVERLIRTPEELSDDEASTLQVAGVTAWNTLFAHDPLREGGDLLLVGAGGVSLYAAQLAAAIGASVHVAVRGDADPSRWPGIDIAGSVSTDEPGWGARALAQNGGADKIGNGVGPGLLNESLDALGGSGEVATWGLFDTGSAPLDVMKLFGTQGSLRGVGVGSVEMHERLAAFLVEHGVRPIIGRTLGFDELPAAYDGATVVGKTVIALR